MEKNPCVGCGACCSHFRVSFFWGECESSGGTVPDEKVIQISSSYVCMKGTEKKPSRCSELCGTVGDDAFVVCMKKDQLLVEILMHLFLTV